MGLSIITPHYKNFDGLKRIFTCLQNQTTTDWEWIIVDDFSDSSVLMEIEKWIKTTESNTIRFIKNKQKSNASICRNIGAEVALFDNLVFMDSDDYFSDHFVANRHIDVKEFAVFGNYYVVDDSGLSIKKELNNTKDFLNEFLAAQFLWQTSCVLWDKKFFNSIGQFHPELSRLQDVELVIRALQNSSCFALIDNSADFYYHIKPIRERQGLVKPVCESVFLFINELLDTSKLKAHQKQLLTSYYYLCAKYLERSGSYQDALHVRINLNMFYKKKFISNSSFVLGTLTLKLYTFGFFSGTFFLRVNRYLFKK